MHDPLTRRASVAGILGAATAFGGAAGTLAGGRRAVQPGAVRSAVLLAGDGIDPTGQRDSREAVQALLDDLPEGATIVNPSGAVLRLDGGLTVRAPRTRITGSGEWRFRSGGTYSVRPEEQNGFLDLRADHCWVDGIYATNPDRILNRGVIFLADYGRVTNTTLVGFGSGIHVSPAGEFHDFVISGNHVLDVLGDGGGPTDTGSGGESYGDGIMCWGAAATITGNVVTCANGADARIGIHVEGLPDQESRTWIHGDSMIAISANIVRGRFRRGIVSEGVDHVVITSNVVADATWWSVALISADHCVVSGNALLYTRTAEDDQGSYWGPSRSAVMLYCVGKQTIVDPVVTDNTVRVPVGASSDSCVRITGGDDEAVAIRGGRIAGNRLTIDGTADYGVLVDRLTVDLEVDDNRVAGFAKAGIALNTHRGASLRRNRIVGPQGSTAFGVRVDTGSRLICLDNIISAVRTGIRAANQSVQTAVSRNAVEEALTGVDLQGTSGALVCSDNVFTDVATALSSTPVGEHN